MVNKKHNDAHTILLNDQFSLLLLSWDLGPALTIIEIINAIIANWFFSFTRLNNCSLNSKVKAFKLTKGFRFFDKLFQCHAMLLQDQSIHCKIKEY